MSVRGQIAVVGRAFNVADNKFFELFSNGSKTLWGTVANDSLPVTMAASPQQLLLASAGTAYVFDLMANTLTAIPGATFSGPVAQAAICDDFFLLTIQNSKEFVVSAPLDATDWVTNGSAIVSVFPDNIVSMFVFQRQIWFFSDTQSVVYYNSGNIFPFDVNPNAFIEAGCAAENSVALANNTILWLGADARGHGKFWQASGYTPTRVSNHAVEFAIQGYSRIDDAVSYTYQDQGHEFYVTYFPTPSATWVLDLTTGMWHQRGSFDLTIAQFKAHRSQNHIFAFGKHLVGDWASNAVYEMNINIYTDAYGTDLVAYPIHRVRRAPHISNEQQRQYFNELEVYLESGVAQQPLLPNAPLAAASDNFNRANENPILAPWVSLGLPGYLPGEILANQYTGTGAGNPGDVLYDGGLSWPSDQFSQATLKALGSGLAILWVRGNISDGVNDGNAYAFVISGGIGVPSSVEIIVQLGNTQATLVSGTITPQVNDVFNFSVVGQVLTVLQNGNQILQVNNSSVAIGKPGLGAEIDGAAGSIAWDDWTSSSIPTFRDPQIFLRWSNDSAHTFSNYVARDIGQAGQFRKRVRWLRLGEARDRVFEISMSDPIAWRIVDAYLKSEAGTN